MSAPPRGAELKAGIVPADWGRGEGHYDRSAGYPNFDCPVSPDVIDGDEAANDALLEEWLWREIVPQVGAPVWHLHESFERLDWLVAALPRIW